MTDILRVLRKLAADSNIIPNLKVSPGHSYNPNIANTLTGVRNYRYTGKEETTTADNLFRKIPTPYSSDSTAQATAHRTNMFARHNIPALDIFYKNPHKLLPIVRQYDSAGNRLPQEIVEENTFNYLWGGNNLSRPLGSARRTLKKKLKEKPYKAGLFHFGSTDGAMATINNYGKEELSDYKNSMDNLRYWQARNPELDKNILVRETDRGGFYSYGGSQKGQPHVLGIGRSRIPGVIPHEILHGANRFALSGSNTIDKYRLTDTAFPGVPDYSQSGRVDAGQPLDPQVGVPDNLYRAAAPYNEHATGIAQAAARYEHAKGRRATNYQQLLDLGVEQGYLSNVPHGYQQTRPLNDGTYATGNYMGDERVNWYTRMNAAIAAEKNPQKRSELQKRLSAWLDETNNLVRSAVYNRQ